MPQSQGSNCKLGWQFETTFRRVPATPALNSAYFSAENFSSSFEIIKSNIIRPGANPVMGSRGNQQSPIGLSTTLAPQLAGLINRGMLGSNNTAGGAPPYTHTGKIGALSSHVWEKYLDNNLYLLYLGCKWREMTLDINASGPINVALSGMACAEAMTLPYKTQTGNFTVGSVVTGGTSSATALILDDLDAGTTGTLIVTGVSGTFANNEALSDGASGAALADITNGIASVSIDPTYTDLGHTPWDAFQITLVREGGAGQLLNVKSGTIRIAKNIDDTGYYIGGRGALNSLPEGRAEVSGTFTMLFDEQAIAIFHKAIRFEETSLRITMQHGSGVGTAGNEHMEIFLPELKFSKATPAIDKETGIEMTISFEGYYDNSSEQSAAQFTFKTAQATI